MIRWICATLLTAACLPAQEVVLRLDPAQTSVEFKLGATLHSVRGTFQLKRGTIRFDESTGAASGELAIDAASGQSGNADRDRDMHTKVLESARYPEIVFRPVRVNGKVGAQPLAQVTMSGTLSIHGAEHEFTIPLEVRPLGGQYSVSGRFSVPYVKWGMKNPSKALLRVSETVEIAIRTTAGQVNPQR